MWQQFSALLYAGSLLTTPISNSAANPLPGNANPPAVVRRIEEVRLRFAVEDEAGALQDVAKDAFTVYDNAQAISSYTAFGKDSDLPLRVGLVIDRSDSIRKEFPAEQQAAERFLRAALRPDVDSIFLLDFTHKLNLRQADLKNLQTLITQVNTLAPGGQTALYDALYAAARSEAMDADEFEPVRRVIILLSDGEDNYSLHALNDAIGAAQRADVSIYCLTVHRSAGYHPGDQVLQALAEASGGGAFIVPDLKHIDAAFSEIQKRVRTEYSVAFHPAAPDLCGYHRLAVRPHNLRLRARARQAYFACNP